MLQEGTFYYSFGPFALYPSGALQKDGKVLRLPPKERNLLELLVQQAGQVVSHRTIEETVWPRQQVSYASIARCVYSLRRLLGGGRAEYVETVPTTGYCFVKPVKRCGHKQAFSVLSVAAATSPLALSHFLEGLAQANRPGPTHQERAVALLEEANRVEGVFPAALGAIAECRMYQATWGYISAREARRRVTKACRRALQADRHLASALCVKGWAQGVLERNYDAGLQTIDAVIGDHPFYAKAHVYRSLVLRSAGRVEECVAAARQAREIDPHSHLIQHALAWGLFCARKTRQALNIERAIARSRPEDTLSHTYIGVMSAYLGRHREAVAACRRAYDISNENPTVATALTYALAQSGEQEEARRLAAVALGCRKPEVLRPHLAMTFVALGDFETAIRLLLEAHDMGCPTAPSALVDPRLGPLAADPRLTCLRDRRHRRLTFS